MRIISNVSALFSRLIPGFLISRPAGALNLQQPAHRSHRAHEETTAYAAGELVPGLIVSMVSYGLFVRMSNGETGLVHNTAICWPGEDIAFGIGDRVNVKVLGFKPGKGLALSIREARRHAIFLSYTMKCMVGSTVLGQVKSVRDYGVFVTLAPGVFGLLHISQIEDITAFDRASIGQAIEVRVTGIDLERQRISLGKKHAPQRDPALVE
jgi:small subunit ribosomal protein S1